MQVQTSRFGMVEIDEAGVVTFPEGIPGFEDCRRFAFIPHRPSIQGKTSPFQWLQSLDNAQLAFLTADPRSFFPDYTPQIPAADRDVLRLSEEAPPASVFALLTVPKDDPGGITANLMAPVVVNSDAGLGRQIIINDDRYGLRHPIARRPEATPSAGLARQAGLARTCAVGS
jgi:flagellar assembly factor FliW